MAGFTILLPGTISYYLWNHWNDLYSTKTNQRIGWLYEPFVRGAEFWQVHDLMMKMVLTGMLIYVPPTSRANVSGLGTTGFISTTSTMQVNSLCVLLLDLRCEDMFAGLFERTTFFH